MSLDGLPAKNGLRVLHSSDVHLDVLGDRRAISLERIVDLAIGSNADLIIIAGDVFDRNRVKSDLIEFMVEQLNRFPGHTALLAGNHDCLAPESVFFRPQWEQAERVCIFTGEDGEAFHLPHIETTIWGRPLLTYGDGPPPLEDMPAPDERARWNLAVAHGYLREEDDPARAWASFQITPEHVAESGMDYIALGDSHAFKHLVFGESTVCYSGSPSSGTHTVAIVDFHEEQGVTVNRVSTLGGALYTWAMARNDAG